MFKSLSVVFTLWISAAAFPTVYDNLDGRIRSVLSPSRGEQTKMGQVELTKIFTNSDLVSLVNSILQSLSQNGTLTEEGRLKLKDLVGYYAHHHGENFTVDGKPTDNSSGTSALKMFLEKLKLKDGDFDYTVIKSVHDEIDIEEEEEETDDPHAKDEIVLDYIKNIDKAIAVENDEPDKEPDDKQLTKLFQLMSL